jgi:hypothetical protein
MRLPEVRASHSHRELARDPGARPMDPSRWETGRSTLGCWNDGSFWRAARYEERCFDSGQSVQSIMEKFELGPANENQRYRGFAHLSDRFAPIVLKKSANRQFGIGQCGRRTGA